jgi:F0F1-type ATP synthase assembly protein I
MTEPRGSTDELVRASFSTPRAAKDAVGELVDHGVDAARVRLSDETQSRLQQAVSQYTADCRVTAMAAWAVTAGLVAGTVIGLLTGLVLWALIDAPAVVALLPLGGAGLLVGGILGGIYRMKENRSWARLLAVPDLDADLPVTVLVNPPNEAQHRAVLDVLDGRAEGMDHVAASTRASKR